MTKAVSRKVGKKGRSEGGKQPIIKSSQKHLQHQEESTSRRWMIVLMIVLCLFIGAVAVFLIPSLQITFKEKLPQGKNFDQNKKVQKKSKDETPRGDGRKQKPAGNISNMLY